MDDHAVDADQVVANGDADVEERRRGGEKHAPVDDSGGATFGHEPDGEHGDEVASTDEGNGDTEDLAPRASRGSGAGTSGATAREGHHADVVEREHDGGSEPGEDQDEADGEEGGVSRRGLGF